MKLKKESQSHSILNLFDVLDSSKKETNLSKVIAYLISTDSLTFGAFLSVLDIKLNQNKKTCLKTAKISIERSYTKNQLSSSEHQAPNGGRTDIEIKFTDQGKKYFIIIECKTSSGKATIEQYNLYKGLFINKKADHNYFVFLSHQSSINLLEEDNNITLIDLNWRDLINTLAEIKSKAAELEGFLEYYERRYGMANQREILIQSLGFKDEINRYKKGVYRRPKVNGSPLYFAPYFPKNHPNHGISSISKILGIITTNDITWQKVEMSCEKFVHNAYPEDKKLRSKLLKRWYEAINIPDSIGNYEVATYYFLDLPVLLEPSLKKDGGIEKGRGKGWIAASIPPNRTVTFAEFLKRYNMAHANE